MMDRGGLCSTYSSLELVEISKAEFGVLGARRKKRIFLPNVILTDSRLEREKREKVWI